ncbi:MAG: Glycerol-3-phosphate dehydrogenase (NAD(P)+) [Lentisphaerae bacterium ADurb.BinA184]|nr:MAG: Glycerol-3-phosphate dehydrogenase (NAD(P)+) [Lentisphaerae bacterium ADurb.BinA184]
MKITVLGDGGWGTALAMLLVGNGHAVTQWGPFADYLDEMARTRANPRFLPGIPLPAGLRLTPDMAAAVEGAELVVLAAPVPYMRPMLVKLAGTGAAARAVLVNVAKGIEVGTHRRPQEIGRELLGPTAWATLSGPSHAEEVARGIPTAVVSAADDEAVARTVQAAFMGAFFRVYTATDVVGVELGGALKNIFAVAAGICDGMGFGDNSKAALMTRGIAEMARLGEALGGCAQTFAGLSGVGDLIVTCISRHSRNRHVGEELGRGATLPQIQKAMGLSVAEGVKTTLSAYELACQAGVSAPIIHEVHAALYEGKDPRQAARDLMTRAAKPE